MGNLIISKKGKSPAIMSLCGVFILVLAVLLFYTSKGDYDFGYKVEFTELMTFATPFLFIMVGVMLLSSASKHSKSYISIYTDHIEGFGVCGKGGTRGQSFNFSVRDSYTVTKEGSFICVNYSNNSYYINLSPADAEAVYRAATTNKNSHGVNSGYTSAPKNTYSASAQNNTTYAEYTPVQPESKVFECPTCKAKCKIPAGTGRVKITCPKCGNGFIVEN